jgi:hypothetical protein
MSRLPIHEIWRNLSQTIGGLFAGDHFFEPPTVRLDHRAWALFLQCISANNGGPTEQVYTVMHVAYQPTLPFALTLRPRKSGDAPCPDGKPTTIGYEQLDNQFFCCTSTTTTARTLISYNDIADMLITQPKVRLRIGSNIWHGVQDPRIDAREAEHYEEIEFRQANVIRDVGVLKSWFDMGGMLLDQMATLGIIKDTMPDLDAPLRKLYKRGGSWINRWGNVPIPDAD